MCSQALNLIRLVSCDRQVAALSRRVLAVFGSTAATVLVVDDRGRLDDGSNLLADATS